MPTGRAHAGCFGKIDLSPFKEATVVFDPLAIFGVLSVTDTDKAQLKRKALLFDTLVYGHTPTALERLSASERADLDFLGEKGLLRHAYEFDVKFDEIDRHLPVSRAYVSAFTTNDMRSDTDPTLLRSDRLDAVRRVLGPNLSRQKPAARYGIQIELIQNSFCSSGVRRYAVRARMVHL
jgi:hypothetical protein